MTTRRDGRGIWVVLGLLVLGGLGGLVLQGIVNRTSASSATPAGAALRVGAGGSVLGRDARGRPTSLRVPERTVALTFDGGPNPSWTSEILGVLSSEHVPATFFVTGRSALRSPGVLRTARAEGDELGIETGPQPGLDLRLGQLGLSGALGETTSLIRLPTTVPDELNRSELAPVRRLVSEGYTVALFDRDATGGRNVSVPSVVRDAETTAPNGAIVAFNDGEAALRALPRVIAHYRAEHYRFSTVSGALGAAPTAALGPVGWMGRLEGVAFGSALTVASGGVAVLNWLVVAFAILTLLRLAVMVGFARRHVRRSRRLRRGRHAFSRGRANAVIRGTRRDLFPPVTVIVPAYNESVGIEAAIRSLLASDYPNVDVLVVDDGSNDGTAEVVDSLGLDRVRVVRKENEGKARALTTGLAGCDSEIVVMVDGDTIFEPEALGRLVAPLQDPRVGAVSGNTKVGNRSGLVGRWQHLEYVSAFNLERRLYDLWHCMPTVPGAIGAFRRRALLDVGGVSDDTLAEDTDLTMALHRAGWLVVYQDDARAWTEAPKTLGQLWRQRYRWCYGTLQATWKHRRAVIEPRSGLGHIGIPSLVLFQVLLPLIGPAIDIYAVYGLLFLNPLTTALLWLGLVGLQAIITGYALRLDGERLGTLWALPLQQFVYRQLMYLVVIRSVVSALSGVRLRWQKLPRSGDLLAAAATAGISLPAAAPSLGSPGAAGVDRVLVGTLASEPMLEEASSAV